RHGREEGDLRSIVALQRLQDRRIAAGHGKPSGIGCCVDDRIRYEADDRLAPGRKVGDPIMTTDGIAVGRFIAAGALSQPVLTRLGSLNEVLFNVHSDARLPLPEIERHPSVQAGPQGIRSGGRERGLRARTGRISWRELVAP
ncbi:MAG: hypothetical protein ABJA49_03325, partial [Betaproteobacteria bacterium]